MSPQYGISKVAAEHWTDRGQSTEDSEVQAFGNEGQAHVRMHAGCKAKYSRIGGGIRFEERASGWDTFCAQNLTHSSGCLCFPAQYVLTFVTKTLGADALVFISLNSQCR